MNATNRRARVGVGQAPKAPATPRVPGRVGVGQAPKAPATPRVPLGHRVEPAYPVDGSGALRPEATPDRPTKLRVAPPAPVAVPRAPFVLLVLVVVIGGVLGILLLNTKIAENAFLLNDLHTKQAALDRQEQQLERELAEQAAAGSLEAAARKLGMVPSGTPAYLWLSDGRVIGVPKPASGQPSVTSQTATRGR